jgi:hypothetical protein
MEQLELKGKVTVGDTARFVYFHQQRRVWWYFLPIALLNILMCLAVLALYLVGGNDEILRSSGVPLFAILAFWSWCFGASPYFYAKKVLGKNAASGEQQMEAWRRMSRQYLDADKIRPTRWIGQFF